MADTRKLNNNITAKANEGRDAYVKRTTSRAREMAIRHLDERNELNAEARAAKVDWGHKCMIEEGRERSMTGIYPRADAAPRRKREGEKIDEKFAKARDDMKKRHEKELEAARAADKKAAGA